ncbi:MAG: TonB family protein [Salinivirgaceae bacterium]
MDKFVLVLLEASAALLLFYLVYGLWLRKETFFKENRFYLLVTAVISLILPWINFSYPSGNEQTITFTNLLEVVSVSANGYEASLIQKVTAWQWASIVYFLGFLFSFCLMLIKLVQITRIDKQSTQTYSGEFPENVRFIKADVVPFSFLNKIYVNPAKYTPEQLGKIVAHERVHVRQQHTYDCLFYELLVVVFWFHPIVYKYRAAAKEVHEYLADQGALVSGISGEAYQKLLFEQATGLQFLKLANSFNYSLVKRRLIMLTKIKSSKWAKIRMLVVLPVLVGLLLMFACKQLDQEVIESPILVNKEKSAFMDGNDSTNTVFDATQGTIQRVEDAEGKKVDEKIYFMVDKMPVFPGEEEELRKFIASNIKYPVEAAKSGIQGRVFVMFIVNSEGNVEDAKVVRGVHPLIDEEALRVINMLPKWTPGEHEGKNVSVQFTVPINFALSDK